MRCCYMKPLDRDTHILEHIVSYCQQIEETVARFGNDGSIFSSDPIYRNAAALCILQRRFEYFSKEILRFPLRYSCRNNLNIFQKGRFPNWHMPNLGNRPF